MICPEESLEFLETEPALKCHPQMNIWRSIQPLSALILLRQVLRILSQAGIVL